MDERVIQFRVGVVALATLLITAILVLVFGRMPSLFPGGYTIYVRFPEAPGVSSETPVRKSGILIGRVTAVRFADDDRTVIVTVRMDRGRKVYHNEVCRATSALLIGDSALEFMFSPDPALPKTPIEDGETIDGVVTQDPTRAIANLQQNLTQTMASVDVASKELGTVLNKLGALLDENSKRITKVVAEADKTLEIVQKTLTSANDVIGDAKTRDDFKQAMAELPQLLRRSRDTVDRMGQTINLVDENLKNMQGLTYPLRDNGQAIVERLNRGADKLDRTMDEMLRFSQSLNSPNSSLGQLMSNPELYQHINRAAKNIDELSRQLKPIVHDARIFSDKIARHPELLGVRGALQRSPGIKD
jgi:phospholipid/cholesterol/gamma-HCH transport system substrate-binding protein